MTDIRIVQRGTHEQVTLTDTQQFAHDVLTEDLTLDEVFHNLNTTQQLQVVRTNTGPDDAPSRRSNYNKRHKRTRNLYAWARMMKPPKNYTGTYKL